MSQRSTPPAALLGLLLGTSALAQTTSDLMPTPPAPPPGGAVSPYYPGMPVPQPAPRGPVSRDDEPKGRAGYIITDDSGGPLVDDNSGAPSMEPATTGSYVVKKGDTLWSISAAYLRNAWFWPKLWAYNPLITNPHWIYPGDVLHLGPPGPPPVAPTVETPEAPRPVVRPTTTGLFLRQTGFVEPDELDTACTIIGSKEEKIMLATLDEAYVSCGKNEPLHMGEKYSVYKPIKTVKHPVTGKRLGEIVEIFGEAEVRTITSSKIARIGITDSTDPIERGYRVGPLRRQFKVVDPRPANGDLSAVVVATLRPLELVGASVIAFVDKGKKDGVEVGNRFYVTRRGDGYAPLLWSGQPLDDKRFPRENIAEILIIDLREGLATGLVTRSAEEARIGDRAETHQGE